MFSELLSNILGEVKIKKCLGFSFLKSKMKLKFENQDKIQPIFTHGKVQVSNSNLISIVSNSLLFSNYETLKSVTTLNPNTDTIHAFDVLNDISVLSSSSLLVHIYKDSTLIKSFKAHLSPVFTIKLNGSVFATGSADSTVCVWDFHANCLARFKGHGGVITSLLWRGGMLISACEDGGVNIWDVASRTCLAALKEHSSAVMSLSLSLDEKYLFTAGRDQLVLVWSLDNFENVATVIVYDAIETCGCLPNDLIYVAGESGVLKIYNWKTNEFKCEAKVTIHNVSSSTMLDSTLILTTSDQNILFYDISDPLNITKTRHVIGFNQEINTTRFIESRLAVCTNSENILIYDLDSKDVEILSGHEDIVKSIDYSDFSETLVSCSKDNTAIMWQKSDDGKFNQVGKLIGHTDSVTSIAIGKKSHVILTSALDSTIKSWCPKTRKANYTIKSHDKQTNDLKISPNDKLFATASQDKTINLYAITSELKGTFKGHKRSVLRIEFSTIDKVLASASIDKTIKIWNITDFTCLRTFEGHLNTVNDLKFTENDTQLISVGSDSLIKLWTIKNSSCIDFEGEGKLTSIQQSKNQDFIVVGGKNGIVSVWNDTTQLENDAKLIENEAIVVEYFLLILELSILRILS